MVQGAVKYTEGNPTARESWGPHEGRYGEEKTHGRKDRSSGLAPNELMETFPFT